MISENFNRKKNIKTAKSFETKEREITSEEQFNMILNEVNHHNNTTSHAGQKIKFSIKDFFSKCDQIRRKLRIWSHLLKKSLMENFIFCAVPQK